MIPLTDIVVSDLTACCSRNSCSTANCPRTRTPKQLAEMRRRLDDIATPRSPGVFELAAVKKGHHFG